MAIVLVLAGAGCGASATSAPATNSAPTSELTLPQSGPTPVGMLPLGPTKSMNQPPAPCEPGIPTGIGGPVMYDAVAMTEVEAQQQPAGTTEVVNYEWAGHRPVAADSLRVTVPSLGATLRPRAARMRMVVALSSGSCFAEWHVTARSLVGYDGAQDAGSGWYGLGDGAAQADAVVVAGLPAGDWIVHVHLGYADLGAQPSHWIDSYVRVLVDDQLAVRPPVVSAPDPPANCAGQSLTGGSPDVGLVVEGASGSTLGTRGSVSTGYGGFDLPAALPNSPIHMRPGSKLTIRTVDGACGNDWSGLMFMPVPDSLEGPIGSWSGLPTNNGSDPTAASVQMIDSMNGLAPAAGEWLVGAMFFFGGTSAVTYYWRVSVS